MKAEKASTTAFLVQQGLLYTATRWSTAHLVPEDSRDAAIRLLSALPEGRSYLEQLDGPARLQIGAKERLLLPGVCVHYAIRKRWIEQNVRGALSTGARQLINLGAGFDTLALRLAAEDHSDLTLIEIDHPATQRAKAAALDGEMNAERIELLPVDFASQTLSEQLPTARTFDPLRPTVVICEGVLPYLDEKETRVLFRSLLSLLGPGTRVVFTFIGRRSPTGRQPYGPLLRAFLTVSGESIKLRCEPDELATLLDSEGFELDEVALSPNLLQSYRAAAYNGPIHDLEMLASATAVGE